VRRAENRENRECATAGHVIYLFFFFIISLRKHGFLKTAKTIYRYETTEQNKKQNEYNRLNFHCSYEIFCKIYTYGRKKNIVVMNE